MTRREIRGHIFLMLFRKDFHEANELKEQMELYISDLEEQPLEDYTEFLMQFRKELMNANELNDKNQSYISELEKPTFEEYLILTSRFQAVVEKLEEIDTLLSEAASGWKLSRMGKVDLTILRLAVYEMRFDEDIPVKVAINEAVEMAKIFGGDESPSFINGVLAKLA